MLAWDRRNVIIAEVLHVVVAVVRFSVNHLLQIRILGDEGIELIVGVIAVVGRRHPESWVD